MKKILLSLLLLVVLADVFSQTANDVGKIFLDLRMPAAITGLDAGQIAKLEIKLNQIISAEGVVADKSASFSVYPAVTVQESGVVEGGLANLTVTTIELTLSIRQNDNQVLFSSASKSFKGSGQNESKAISNAITKIQAGDKVFKEFFQAGKAKILAYYEGACESIIAKSDNMVMLQKYEQALALLMSVPQEVKCFSTIEEKSIIAFGALQNQQCTKQLQLLKAAIAGEKLDQAVEIMGQIDPASSCYPETERLMSTLGGSSPVTRGFVTRQLQYKNTDSLKKIRLAGIKKVAFQYEHPVATSPTAAKTTTVVREPVIDQPEKNTNTVPPPDSKRRFYALIIGVEKYDDPDINTLSDPIKDAGLLMQVLVDHYTFNQEDITFLTNPDFEHINIAFEDLTAKITPNDFLLIFYAGHGYFDEKTNIGYWLPSDASKKNRARWFRNSALVENIRAINSRHTLLIADACFSGGIFKTRAPFNNSSTDIAYMIKKPSRKAMTSGSLTTVPDKSIFMKYLLKTLNENQNLFLSSEDLFDEVKTSMKNNADTKPLYGEIQNAGDEGGNFVLIRRN